MGEFGQFLLTRGPMMLDKIIDRTTVKYNNQPEQTEIYYRRKIKYSSKSITEKTGRTWGCYQG